MPRYALEIFNPDSRKWVRLPDYSAASMTEALCYALAVFDGLECRATPILH